MKTRILSAFFALASAVVSAQTATTFYPSSDANITYMGRVHAAPSAHQFTYPGVSIITRFTGSYLAMHAKPGSGYFMVEIDDRYPFKIEFAVTDSVVVLAESLPEGEHEARIMYVVEGYELKPEFYGFSVAEGSALVKPAPLPERKMEFIGNSITCGYGVEGLQTEGFSYKTENHYYTYASITARELGAQYMAVARSGIGIYRNYGAPREGSPDCMPVRYNQTLFANPDIIWDPAQYTPHVVCLNLGTNDTSLDNYDTTLLYNAYEAFVRRLRKQYPEAHIVLLTGTMLSGQALADVKASLDKVKDTLAAEGDVKVYRFDMTPQSGSLGIGADWHPSMRQQRKMADELIPFIRQITGWNN